MLKKFSICLSVSMSKQGTLIDCVGVYDWELPHKVLLISKFREVHLLA